MYFYLKNKNTNSKSLILLRYYVAKDKKLFQLSTKLSIKPSDWSFDNRMPIVKRGLASVESRQLTNNLNSISEKLQAVLLQYGKDVRVENLKEAFYPKRERENVEDLFVEFIEERKLQGTVSKSSIQKYNVVFDKYQNFCAKGLTKYKILQLNDDFYVNFLSYMRHEHDLNDNTLSRYLNFFKTFVLWCSRKGIDINMDYKKVSVKKYEADGIALTTEDVKTLEDAELTGAEEKARDLFLIGVYSGQRFSDYSVFDRADVQGKFIIKRAEKTEKHSYIPLHNKLKDLLDKYDWRLPKISSQKFNVRIQAVCKKLGFDEQIKKTTYRGKKKIVEVLPKWRMVASHTARRTYTTLACEAGIADHFVMAVTGIKDPKTLQKYKKLNKEMLFKSSASFWV
jgi:site-specific recombinase XerD